MRSFVGITAALAVSLVSFAASANNGGVAGYTGKPNINAPQGESCNQCHSGGTTPTVTINGPASLAAGASAEYTLVVSTGQTRAAGGVAATDGVVLTPGTGLRDSFGEMVQNAPLAVSGGQATFRFTVKAPASGTTLRLWAVGLAANNNGSTSGDKAAQVTKDVTITGGATPKPDAGPGTGGSTTDAGAGTSSSSGDPGGTSGTSSSSGTAPDPTDDPANAADPGDDDDGEGAPASSGGTRPGAKNAPGANAQSCAASPIGGGSGAMIVGLAAVAIAAAARRRRQRA